VVPSLAQSCSRDQSYVPFTNICRQEEKHLEENRVGMEWKANRRSEVDVWLPDSWTEVTVPILLVLCVRWRDDGRK